MATLLRWVVAESMAQGGLVDNDACARDQDLVDPGR
jgi:hypothetical protein